MSEILDVTTTILHPPPRHEAEILILTSLGISDVPVNLHQGLCNYLLLGIRPGDFLTAVLKNDLRDAVCRSIDPSKLGPLVEWLNNAVPAPSWGSPQRVERWITYKTVPGASL